MIIYKLIRTRIMKKGILNVIVHYFTLINGDFRFNSSTDRIEAIRRMRKYVN